MVNRAFINTVVIASSSAVSFLIGTQLTSDRWNSTSRFTPQHTVGSLNAEMSTSSTLFYQKSEDGVPLKVQLDNMEIWKRPSRAAEIMKFGYPGFDNLRTYEDFVLSYDRRTRTAHWVIEHLSPDRLTYNEDVDRSKCVFRPDESIHPFFRSQNSDYFRSGYDRGHLAAAGNHRKTQEAIDQTFFLTNMSPQVGKGFNRDKWNDLERHCRRKAKNHPNVYICTGPLYLPHKEDDGHLYIKYKVIGLNHVAVPTHFFKVILFECVDGSYELECYLMPNAAIPDNTPISDFFVSIDSIERPAGFLIFENMPHDKIVKINGKQTGKDSCLSTWFANKTKSVETPSSVAVAA